MRRSRLPGQPWRALRLAGGDLNAILALAGLAVGIAIRAWFLKSGYSLGRATKTCTAVGWILPPIIVGPLLLLIFRPSTLPAWSHPKPACGWTTSMPPPIAQPDAATARRVLEGASLVIESIHPL